MTFRRRTNLPGISPPALKELIGLQADIASDAEELRKEAIGSTTDTKQSSYAARFNERVRVLPPVAGLALTFPQANSKTQNKWIEVLKLGGGPVLVAPISGTVQGAATLTLTTDGLYSFGSDGADGWWMTPSLSPASVFAQVYPIGSIYLSTNSTNPATTLGFGTWTAFGAGRVPVGFAAADPDFGVDEGTGGAKTVASTGTNTAITAGTPAGTCSSPTFTGSSASTNLVSAGTPAGTCSAPTFSGTPMGTHVHELPLQLVSNVLSRQLPAATFGTGTSRAAQSQQVETANTTNAPVALSQAISAGTPAGTVSSPTFTGSPMGTHQHTVTATGTVSAPTFTGSPMATHNHTFTGSASSVLQPFIVVRMWKRTA